MTAFGQFEPLRRRQRVRVVSCDGYDVNGLYGEVMKGPEGKGLNECYLVAVENTGTLWIRSTHIAPIVRSNTVQNLPVQPFPPMEILSDAKI